MEFIDNFDGVVIACDTEGTIIYVNEKAAANYQKEGGHSLIGKNLKDCHKDSSNDKIKKMMETHEKNVYTIEKNGKKKLIYQAPWFHDGVCQGLVELSLEIPFDMPHYIRENN
jgi:transcriptional regulator with PAS, ATPase and Fis domain